MVAHSTSVSKENCKGPGILRPVVDFNKCEGKEDCVRVCPYDVFEMRRIADEDRKGLSFIGKVKTWVHPNKAYVPDPGLCQGCGLCVTACPEKAIKLQRQ